MSDIAPIEWLIDNLPADMQNHPFASLIRLYWWWKSLLLNSKQIDQVINRALFTNSGINKNNYCYWCIAVHVV